MLSNEEIGPPPSEPPSSDEDVSMSPSFRRRASSVIPTDALPRLLREGWLDKQERGDAKVWRKRWFTLTTTRFMYYKHQRMAALEDSISGNAEQGEIPLHLITNLTVPTMKGGGEGRRSRNHILIIDVPGRRYVLSGESHKSVASWRKDIHDILQSGSFYKRIAPPPPLEDYHTGKNTYVIYRECGTVPFIWKYL